MLTNTKDKIWTCCISSAWPEVDFADIPSSKRADLQKVLGRFFLCNNSSYAEQMCSFFLISDMNNEEINEEKGHYGLRYFSFVLCSIFDTKKYIM